MQEAYYLPVSPEDNQCWEIQRDDKFLIEADQTNEFDFRGNDFSTPKVLRVSVIQKTPQRRNEVGDGIKDDDDDDDSYNVVVENDNGLVQIDDSNDETNGDSDVDNNGTISRIEDDEAITCDAMQIGHAEHLSENIWNDYSTPEVTSLVENNLENVINQELLVTAETDMVQEQIPQSEQGTSIASVNATANEKITIFQTIGFGLSVGMDNDPFGITCRCCNKNFTFHDLKLHIAEKSTEGYFSCDWCTEIFLLKDLNNHVLSHLSAEHSSSQQPALLPETTWYNHSTPISCEVEREVATESEEKRSLIKSAENESLAASFQDTANTSSFTPLFVSLPSPSLSSVQKNELPSIKRVKTELPVVDASNLKMEDERLQFIERTIVNDNQKDHDHEVRCAENKEKNELKVSLIQETKEEENCRIKIQCPKCKEQFKFEEEAEIDAYIKKHIPTTYYKCGFCDTIVTDKHEFNEHMKNHTTVVESNSGNKFPYKCSYCENLAFKTIEELTSHIEMHVPRNVFVCPKCSAQFVRESKKPEARIRQSVKKDPVAVTSGTMNKLMTTPVLTPADKATIRDNFKCTTCMAIFRRQDDFNKHVKTHIMPDTKQQVSDVKVDPSYCAYCSSELLSIAEIIVHIRKHTEERKQFPCSNCDKKTTSDRNNSSNANNRGKENLCNYCLNFRVHG